MKNKLLGGRAQATNSGYSDRRPRLLTPRWPSRVLGVWRRQGDRHEPRDGRKRLVYMSAATLPDLLPTPPPEAKSTDVSEQEMEHRLPTPFFLTRTGNHSSAA